MRLSGRELSSSGRARRRHYEPLNDAERRVFSYSGEISEMCWSSGACTPTYFTYDKNMAKRVPFDVFHALSGPTRRKVLEQLARRGELRVRNLVELTGRSQPLVSQYVAVLTRARLVASRSLGRWLA